ncbi:MAG: nicotinate-nucleotide adenylyltransferase [Xanthomonadales bacterium]|nr:putative nicotinate-nucleotide adenylyltransferase [Xanthomonadales bacterium]MCC6593799.1 nicotinate-nucleotide adenylyltransferase [Xanthomonadales bacterium]MCE7931745.1 nicotinate-nucleotide adenylyltransferase [Xanthomonadales bacterium PRO6]
MSPLALFGGTFDPIHVGHLRAAIEAREALAADEIRLLPCALPPHREQPEVGAEQRLRMLKAAIAGQPGLRADERELRRSGPSYTYDTLVSVRAEIGESRPLVLVLGADAFAGLPDWHRWRELIAQAHLAVLTRPDAHGLIDPRLEELLATVGTADPADLRRTPCGRLLRLQIPPLPLSSTLVRERLRRGRSVRFLVPDAVLAMIESQGWYGVSGC